VGRLRASPARQRILDDPVKPHPNKVPQASNTQARTTVRGPVGMIMPLGQTVGRNPLLRRFEARLNRPGFGHVGAMRFAYCGPMHFAMRSASLSRE
jgi:hypothetical protein